MKIFNIFKLFKSKDNINLHVPEDKRFFKDKEIYHTRDIVERVIKLNASYREYKSINGEEVCYIRFNVYDKKTYCHVYLIRNEMGMYRKQLLEINKEKNFHEKQSEERRKQIRKEEAVRRNKESAS
ncbi:MAG: hypothetical protein ACOC1K_03155 [Nanoarchaeota archaeon]